MCCCAFYSFAYIDTFFSAMGAAGSVPSKGQPPGDPRRSKVRKRALLDRRMSSRRNILARNKSMRKQLSVDAAATSFLKESKKNPSSKEVREARRELLLRKSRRRTSPRVHGFLSSSASLPSLLPGRNQGEGRGEEATSPKKGRSISVLEQLTSSKRSKEPPLSPSSFPAKTKPKGRGVLVLQISSTSVALKWNALKVPGVKSGAETAAWIKKRNIVGRWIVQWRRHVSRRSTKTGKMTTSASGWSEIPEEQCRILHHFCGPIQTRKYSRARCRLH